ncbi:LytR cell envelope-related transcriptional attenuator [Geodermatophilus dictyosporus]|uniref:LytR cell envelope-related transcriptional attenuator n=1 Tax=Geodermatophilus dictyosporus TaxID=1523247 RepID=A0A1I5QYP6_9ACTN|nr:LytR C-terminal domain-containing protein [Geodermatophilus dictyosporus]SFP50926.1 LytR cell envelope-related transcriptional attenuator [Geodermatophilus dictyosporus]
MSVATETPPVRPRKDRRLIPPLVFLLVLALAALGVWWKVLSDASAREEAADAACATAEAAPPSLDPSTVAVRVFNATDTAGLAQTVAAELQQRGFVVEEIANDSSDREVTGPGEVRHGPAGGDAAAYLGLFLPGAGSYQDTRADARVDLVIGPEFDRLASPEEVAATLTPIASAEAAC